ncbi:MAG: hypothetical protein Fur0023_07230 [Bacteroidia bacterium]
MSNYIYAIKVTSLHTEGLDIMKVKIGRTNNLVSTLRQYQRSSANAELLGVWEVNESTGYNLCERGAHLIAEKYSLKREREIFTFLVDNYNEYHKVIGCFLKEVKKSEYENDNKIRKKGHINKINDISGQKPMKFTFLEKEFSVQSWKEVLVKIVELLHSKNPDFTDKISDISYFSKDKNKLRRPHKIANTNYYVETNLSANYVYKLVLTVLQKFGYQENELKIFFK